MPTNASLRSKLIRLAHARSELRAELLPLISREAGRYKAPPRVLRVTREIKDDHSEEYDVEGKVVPETGLLGALRDAQLRKIRFSDSDGNYDSIPDSQLGTRPPSNVGRQVATLATVAGVAYVDIDTWAVTSRPPRGMLAASKTAGAISATDGEYLRPMGARQLAIGGVTGRSEEHVLGILTEAAAFMLGDDPSFLSEPVRQVCTDAATRFILKMRPLSRAVAPVIPEAPKSGVPLKYRPEIIARNSSSYSTDEISSNREAVLALDMYGGLHLHVTEHYERSYAGGGALTDMTLWSGIVGSLSKPALGLIRSVLVKKSHMRTSLSSPFSNKWSSPYAPNGPKASLSEILPLILPVVGG